MGKTIIQPQGRGLGKKKLTETMKQELDSGMLTYEGTELLQVQAPRVEMMPAPRHGFPGRIKDWIFGREMKPQAVMVIDKEKLERLKKHMENFRDNTDMVAACGVTAGEVMEACSRVTVLARGHCIRNADGTVTDVSNDPDYITT